MCAGHDGAGDWDKEDAYEAQLRKERGEPEVTDLGHVSDGMAGLPPAALPHMQHIDAGPAAHLLQSCCRHGTCLRWQLAFELLCRSLQPPEWELGPRDVRTGVRQKVAAPAKVADKAPAEQQRQQQQEPDGSGGADTEGGDEQDQPKGEQGSDQQSDGKSGGGGSGSSGAQVAGTPKGGSASGAAGGSLSSSDGASTDGATGGGTSTEGDGLDAFEEDSN